MCCFQNCFFSQYYYESGEKLLVLSSATEVAFPKNVDIFFHKDIISKLKKYMY